MYFPPKQYLCVTNEEVETDELQPSPPSAPKRFMVADLSAGGQPNSADTFTDTHPQRRGSTPVCKAGRECGSGSLRINTNCLAANKHYNSLVPAVLQRKGQGMNHCLMITDLTHLLIDKSWSKLDKDTDCVHNRRQ